MSLIGLGILAVFHKSELTPLMECLYFGVEYSLLIMLFIYLATFFTKFKDVIFFRILSFYFGLKFLYNIGVYIPYIRAKLVLGNSEFWGYIFTLIIIAILIIIQLTYVIQYKKGKNNFFHSCSNNINTTLFTCKRVTFQGIQKRIRSLYERSLRCINRGYRSLRSFR